MKTLLPFKSSFVSLSIVAMLSGCGGGGGDDGPAPTMVPTVDTTPTQFSFVDKRMAEQGSPVDSDVITVAGINAASTISVSGGEYSLDGGDFTSDESTVLVGQEVVVRVISDAESGGLAEATLTIGGVSDTFSVTTAYEVLSTVKVEAESANVLTTAATSEVTEASGGSVVGNLMENGAGVEFTDVPASVTLRLAYATDTAGTLSVRLDGQDAGNFELASTGSMTTFATSELELNVDKGASVQVVYNEGDVNASVDFVDFIPSPLQVTSTVLERNFTGADGISVAANGDIYISGGADSRNLRRVTPEGEATIVATGFGSANGSDFDSQGNLYIADYRSDAIRKYTPEGELETFATNLNGPAGVYVDAQDNVYVSLFGRNFSASGSTVLKFTPDGVEQTYASGGGLADVIGIVGDENGEIYACNWQSGRVYRVTDGEVTLVADVPSNINMIDYSRGKIYVAHGTRVHTVDVANGDVDVFTGDVGRGNIDGHIAEARYDFLAASAFSPDEEILYILEKDTGDLRKISMGD